MLESLRKFSSSIYAKIFLGIIIIPFVFWGMGPVFQSGKQNSIVVIGKENIPTQEFIEYIKYYVAPKEKIDEDSIEKALPNFIGNKLIVEEIEDLDIRVSDISLSKIIKNEKTFRKENAFSRTEYEKYLVENNLNAAAFEQHILEQEKKKQLFDFIGGGIVPSSFLINLAYDKVNQKRNIQIINLNDVFIKKLNFSENQIKSYFDQNKDNYKKLYKSVKFIELNQKNLTENDEFTDLFFKKIDEIDDLIAEGKQLDFILEKFSLGLANSATFDISGKNRRAEMIDNFPAELIRNIFDVNETESTVLIEHEDKYFILEINKTENVQRELADVAVKKEVLLNLQKEAKRKLIVEIISLIK